MSYKGVSGSLLYGKVLSKIEFKLLLACLCLLSLLPIATIFLIIIGSCGLMDWDTEMIFSISLSNIVFGIAIFILAYMVYYHKKLYKNVDLWLEDAIEALAFAQRRDVTSINYRPYQVEFSFSIDGKEYKRLSLASGLIMWGNRQFLKYHNKCVKILYSPKYDQVMILKD